MDETVRSAGSMRGRSGSGRRAAIELRKPRAMRDLAQSGRRDFQGAAVDCAPPLARARWTDIMSRSCAKHERRLAAVIVALVVAASAGCREEALQRGPGDGGSQAANLSPQQASLVLAKVGDGEITLGEFAATLERMDRFDRLRYRTPERRRELLEEMITVELLAREAERRELDEDPRAQEALRQILRDAILQDARKGARGPAEFTKAEVEAYYNAHKDDYLEPERRRISHVVVGDQKKAERLLEKAEQIDDNVAWGKFVLENSEEYADREHTGSVETAGDLGLVGPPGDRRGTNPRVPDAVREAVFRIRSVGDVLDEVVKDERGRFHIVRLVGLNKAHARSFEEAERTIRIIMSQQEVAAREKQLEAELRQQFPVTIDESALADVEIPKPSKPRPPLLREPEREPPKPPRSSGHGHGHGHGHDHAH